MRTSSGACATVTNELGTVSSSACFLSSAARSERTRLGGLRGRAPPEASDRFGLLLGPLRRCDSGDADDLGARFEAGLGPHRQGLGGGGQPEPAQRAQLARVLAEGQRERRLLARAQRLRQLHHQPVAFAVGDGEGPAGIGATVDGLPGTRPALWIFGCRGRSVPQRERPPARRRAPPSRRPRSRRQGGGPARPAAAPRRSGPPGGGPSCPSRRC